MKMWPPHWPPQTAAARNAPGWTQKFSELFDRNSHNRKLFAVAYLISTDVKT